MAKFRINPRTGIVTDKEGNQIENWTLQQKGRLVLRLKHDEEVYPVSTKAREPFLSTNIRRVIGDEIYVDGNVLRRFQNNLFISNKGYIFDINRFEFISSHEIEDKQELAHAILRSTDFAKIYPKSTKVKYIFAASNLSTVLGQLIYVNGERFVQEPRDEDLYISWSLKVFDINRFQFISEGKLPNGMNRQNLAQLLYETDEILYPRTITSHGNIVESDLSEFEHNSIVSINHIPFKQYPMNEMFLFSSKQQVFDLESLSFIDFDIASDLLKSYSLSEAARILKWLDDQKSFIYPKSTKIKNILKNDNLVISPYDKSAVEIDGHKFIHHPEKPYLLFSYRLKVFDINKMEFIDYNMLEDYSLVEIAKMIKGNIKDSEYIYPRSTGIKYILDPSNLEIITNDMMDVVINGNSFYRHPKLPTILFSRNGTTFDLETFNFTKDDSKHLFSQDTTIQDLAQIVLKTEKLVYPGMTDSKHKLKNPLYEVPQNDKHLFIHGKSAHFTTDPYILLLDDGRKFNLKSFDYIQPISKSINKQKTIQEQCREIMKADNDVLFCPINTKRKQLITFNNLQQVTNKLIMDKTNYKQHPYYKNIIGTKSCKLFDLESFQFIEPSTIDIRIKLPFMKSSISKDAIEIDENYVYCKLDQTINNKPIDWEEPKKGTIIKDIRYVHPHFSDYFVDFYGKPYKIKINVDTDTESIQTVSLSNDMFTARTSDSLIETFSLAKFAFECYNQRSVKSNHRIEIIQKYPLNYKFRYCKWNLQEVYCSDTDEDTKHRYRWPGHKFARYAYDDRDKTIHSYNAYNECRLIKSDLPYLTLSDCRLQFSFDNRVRYPKAKFIYECLNQEVLEENDFVINNQVIKFGTDTFTFNQINYTKTKNPLFYIGTDSTIFYVPYNNIVRVYEGKVLLSKLHPERNVELTSIIDS